MVALPSQYNVADYPDTGGGLPLIPPGKYRAVIVESDMKTTKDGNGQYLALKFVITEGQYANTEFTERLNLINNNATAVEIARKTLARICDAFGMDRTPSDSNALHNRPLLIAVETEIGKPYKGNDGVERQGKDKSIIKGYSGIGSESPIPFDVPAAAGVKPAAAPWGNR